MGHWSKKKNVSISIMMANITEICIEGQKKKLKYDFGDKVKVSLIKNAFTSANLFLSI